MRVTFEITLIILIFCFSSSRFAEIRGENPHGAKCSRDFVLVLLVLPGGQTLNDHPLMQDCADLKIQTASLLLFVEKFKTSEKFLIDL